MFVSVIFSWIFFWILCGVVCAMVASNKGRDITGWFLIGALLGPIGIVISLVSSKNEGEIEDNNIRSGNYKKCPDCAELIKSEAVVCKHCGRKLNPSQKGKITAIDPEKISKEIINLDDWIKSIEHEEHFFVNAEAGLVWITKPLPDFLNLEEANSICSRINLKNLLGYRDWRIPSIEELSDLIDVDRKDGYFFNPDIFPDLKRSVDERRGVKDLKYISNTIFSDSHSWIKTMVFISGNPKVEKAHYKGRVMLVRRRFVPTLSSG